MSVEHGNNNKYLVIEITNPPDNVMMYIITYYKEYKPLNK